MAVAFKYACFQTFCIPTENLMDDPDKDTPPPSTKKTDGEESNESKFEQTDDKRAKLLKELADELLRTGYSWESVAKTYKLNNIDEMSNLQIKDCISKMKSVPDKEVS